MMKWITMLVVGIILALGPIWGLVGTVLGMINSFEHIAESEADAAALSSDISLALVSTVAGIIALPIGIILIVIASIKLSKARKQDEPVETV